MLAIDGTMLELPDTEELQKEYGAHKCQEGQRESVRALGSCLYDVVNNWVIDAQIENGKEQGYKYDYKVNMNTLIGLMRKRFILILINMTINGDEKSKVDYDNMIEEMSKNLIPVRPDRKNPRNKYKGYNKYRQNYKRNS